MAHLPYLIRVEGERIAEGQAINPKKTQSFRGVSLRRQLVEEVEKFVNEYPQYKGIADFVHEAVRIRMEDVRKLQLPRLEYVNCDENGVKILDRSVHELVHVRFTPEGVFCERCEADDCLHVEFAFTRPAVQAIIREKRKQGWRLPLQ